MKKFSFRISEILKLFMLMVSFIATLWVLVDPSKPDYYNFLFLEPLTFTIMTIISWNSLKYVLTRISLSIIYLSYFMRMAFVPLVMSLGEYATVVPDSILVKYTVEAIIVSIVEFLVLSIYIISKAKYSCGNIGDNYRIARDVSYEEVTFKRAPQFLRIMVVIMIIYILYMFSQDNTIIRQNFSLIVGTPDDWYIRTGYRALGEGGNGVLGIMVTIIVYLFWYVQALIPPMLLIRVMNKYRNNESKKHIYTLLIAGLVLLITSGTRAHSVECAAAFLVLAYSIYGERFGRRISTILPIAIVVVFLGIVARGGTETGFRSLSMTFSAYFSGVQNISTAIYGVNETGNFGIKNIPADVLTKIPIFGNWFKSVLHLGNTTGRYFNSVISSGYSLGQIIPCVGQGYSYFGPYLGLIMAPLLPLLAASISISFDSKAMNEESIIKKNVYLIASIMMARAVVMTNMMSAISYLFNTFVTLAIVYVGTSFRARR